MIKKIFQIFLIVFLGTLLNSSISANGVIQVENAFLDINKDYKYYDELQTLYNKGIIEPEDDHKFHPDKLLNRDEFVGIAVETSCKKCIGSDVSPEFVDQYKTRPFFDIGLDNKYFYCVADAKESSFVLGYGPGVRCNDGTQKDSESPFCTNNNIKLEEALAVVMRMGGIMTVDEADKITAGIQNGQKYPDLALDLKPVNTDRTANSFYPYFKKALEYEVIDYDALGNKKIYKLVEKKGEYLRPDTLITKQDFLRMAFVALKANSCSLKNDNQLAVKIKIFENSCNSIKVEKDKCNLANLDDNDNVLDFGEDVGGACKKGIDDEKGYVWRFVSKIIGAQVVRYGKLIDNYDFLDLGDYKVFLRVTDRCGNTGEVYNTLYFNDNDETIDLKVSIDANPIVGNGPLEVDFKPIVNGGKGPYEYKRDFGDATSWDGKIIKHIFIEKGIYEVNLTVVDSEGNIANATALIKVLDNICSNDSDSDGVGDCKDMCPIVYGESENSGCPIFIKENISYDTPECLEKTESTGFIFGNVVCSSCPCSNSVDFRATLRECDTVIPAITSPSEKDIYSRGKLFQILK